MVCAVLGCECDSRPSPVSPENQKPAKHDIAGSQRPPRCLMTGSSIEASATAGRSRRQNGRRSMRTPKATHMRNNRIRRVFICFGPVGRKSGWCVEGSDLSCTGVKHWQDYSPQVVSPQVFDGLVGTTVGTMWARFAS